MKKTMLFVLVALLTLGVATVLWAAIAGTPHDVRVMTGDASLEPCVMCHTPHSGTGQYPIWNRTQGAQTYIVYNSPSFDMAPARQPQSPSSLCLVCHNGVFSELVNYPGGSSPVNENYDYEMNSMFWAMLGTDLRDDHPISFTYNPLFDDVQDNNGFPQSVKCSTTDRRWIPGPGGSLYFPLYGSQWDQFECATCHAVHHTSPDKPYGEQMVGGKSVGTQVYFLRADNAGSAMCNDCHVNR
jgi:mono/diheme cytochrome c family protein